MRARFVGVLGTLVFLVVSACSSHKAPAEGVAESRQEIQGGTVDTTHTFAVGVCGGGSKGNCISFCSGALITPNLVATARHCVDASPQIVDCAANPSFGSREFGSNYWVTTSSDMSQSTTGWHNVSKIIVPTDKHVCGNDIALLILDNTISAGEAKPVIPGVQYPMYDARYGTKFTAIGFGATSPSNQGYGTRRILQNINVLCIPGSPDLDCAGAQLNENEFIGGDGVCEGDSGSSSYEQKSLNAGAPVSFGVLSRASIEGTQCQGSLYTRFDKWRDLVISAANEASVNWTLYNKPNPDWTVYVPPVVDAGTDSSKTTVDLGGACTGPKDCVTNLCLDDGDGHKVCSKACDATQADSCPTGFVCSDSYCLAKAEEPAVPAATTTTTTSSGCSTTNARNSSGSTGLLLGFGLGFAALRRRRSARK